MARSRIRRRQSSAATSFERLEVRRLLTADFSNQQGYLLPASQNGIDAQYAWTQPGGTGRNVTVLDIEYATWNLDHEDLSKGAGAFLQNGTGRPFDFTDDHGTQVVGILVADNNGEGVTGIVADADLHVMNHSNDAQSYLISIQSAVKRATNVLDAGDVMIIEANMNGPGNTSVPVEYDEGIYNAIVDATNKGIIVLQTAGNDPTNLNLIPEFNGARPDSGSIIVGAGQSPANGTNLRAAHNWTVYGDRVNLQGWGDNVTTIGGHSGLNGASISPCRSGIDANLSQTSAQPCSDTAYTNTFNGTSSATPIVAGAAAALSSAAIELGFPLSPREVRDLLVNTGTAQNTTVNPNRHIGPLPNLKAALDTLRSTIVNQLGDTDDGDRSNGLTTFREAVAVANSTPGEQTIRFNLPAGPQTIIVDQVNITDSARIEGPGAELLQISGDRANRVLQFGGDGENVYHLSGVTIAHGMAVDGSGVDMRNGGDDALHISDSVIRDNVSSSNGGGLHVAFGGEVFVSNSSFLDNEANTGGGALLWNVDDALFTNVTFDGNSAAFGGGSIAHIANGDGQTSPLSVLNSTFVRNENLRAAGIWTVAQAGAEDATLRYGNSIFTENIGSNLFATASTSTSLGGNVLDDNSGQPGDIVTSQSLVEERILSDIFVSPVIAGTPAIDNSVAQNFAPFGIARQSSIHSGRIASLAIDGDPGSSSHTAAAQDSGNHWWEVELPVNVAISEVVLHNREDCCASRLRDIRVEVLDANGLTVYSSSLLNPENNGFTHPNGPESITLIVTDDEDKPVSGRTVRVTRLRDDDLSGSGGQGNNDDPATLQLGEFEVNGTPATDQRGAARNYDGDRNGTPVADSGAYEYSPIIVTTNVDEPLVGDTLVTPIGVTSNTVGTDLYPALHLIDNSGFSSTPGINNYQTLTHDAGDNESRSWVTNDPGGFPSDYFATAAPNPVLTFELGDAHLLADMLLWGYRPHGNDSRILQVDFSLDGSPFANSVTVEHTISGETHERISLGQTIMADTVRVEILDNYFGIDGRVGGDRVGLGEVKFLAHAGDGLCSLREAIAAANHNSIQGTAAGECTAASATDTIMFANNIGSEILMTAGQLTLSESVNISGPGANSLTINANDESRIFEIENQVRSEISGLTLTNGAPGEFKNGGAILNRGRLKLVDSRVTHSAAQYGGGINNFGSGGSATLELLRSEVADNTATANGGGLYNWGQSGEAVMVIDSSTIADNQSSSYGGGGFNWRGNLTVRNSTLSGNNAGREGGAFFDLDGQSLYEATTIFNNEATDAGGGIALENAQISLAQTILAGNTAPSDTDFGGGFNSTGTLNSFGYNIFGNTHIALNTVTTDSINSVPQLVPLSVDPLTGLRVHMPESGSDLVVDVIPTADSRVSTDQRGTARPHGNSVDIGAIELGPAVDLDIDGNGMAQPLTDGVVILRFLAGFSGSTLVENSVDLVNGTRTEPDAVADHLRQFQSELDVDGNGSSDPLTDGILILRYLAGFAGRSLIRGAVDPIGSRTTESEISAYLDSLLPPTGGSGGGSGPALQVSSEDSQRDFETLDFAFGQILDEDNDFSLFD